MASVAGAHGHAGDHLTAAMPAADVVEFFDFVRARLDAARNGGAAASMIGSDALPSREAVRFAAAVGQRHLDDEIVATRASSGEPVGVAVAFMGLTGPAGVLPDHYTERVVDHRREREAALAAFLDLFNHRAISQFWRAWAKYRLPVAFEGHAGTLDDPFSRAFKALAGLGIGGEAVPDEALLSMTGALSRQVRSAGALRRIVAGTFGLPVEVIELEGRWVDLAASEQTRLGAGRSDDGAFATLGHDAVAGVSVWDVGSRFRVRLGPLDFARFRSFFDDDGPRGAITDTIRRAVGGNVDFTIQLVLRREDVPMLRLSHTTPAALGQSTWLLAGAADRDHDEAVLSSRFIFRGALKENLKIL